MISRTSRTAVDFLSLYFCIFEFGMQYFFMDLIPNFRISIVFVKLNLSDVLVTFY